MALTKKQADTLYESWLWYTPENTANKATDFTTSNNTLYPSVQAVKTYADWLVVGLLDDRGNYDASGNVFPSSGWSGTAGAILKGDLWYISVAWTLWSVAVAIGDTIRALTDTPWQTAGNWDNLEWNIGYVPENVANKDIDWTLTANSDTKYPSQKAVKTYADTKQSGDATLTALASYNTNGLLTQTAADTFTGRTLTGTANRITITNGDWVAGNPTTDISSAYVGQNTITTLWTITTGVWNGTTIAVANGWTWSTTTEASRTALGATGVLSTTTGIDAKTIATTDLYTVPAAKTAVILGAIVRCTAATAVITPPTLGVGTNGTQDNMFASVALTGLTSTWNSYNMLSIGVTALGNATEVIKLGIDTWATATTMTLSIDLIGYLL